MDWTKVCTIYLYSIYKWSAAAWRHDYHCFFPFHSRGFKKGSLGRRHYSIYTRNRDLAWRSSAVWDAKINNRGSSDYADFGFDKKVVQYQKVSEKLLLLLLFYQSCTKWAILPAVMAAVSDHIDLYTSDGVADN